MLLRVFRRQIFTTALTMSIWLIFFLLTPLYFLRELTQYTQPNSDRTLGFGIFLALGMIVSDSLRSIFAHQYWQKAQGLGSDMRTLMYAVVYRKAIELRDLSGYSVGELSNLCSNDGQRFYDACTNVMFMYSTIIMVVVVIVATTLMVGYFALLGCGVYLLFIPLQVRFELFFFGGREIITEIKD